MIKVENLFFLIIMLVILILILLPFIIVFCNNMIAKNVEKELLKTPIPNNTEIIDSISIAGKLVGNGNGMQYFGAILIKTDLRETDIINYYSKYRKNDWSYLIEKQESNRINILENGEYNFKNMTENNKDNYYIIYSWGKASNFLLEIDLRGH